jgi:hypothetical protein
MGRPTIDGKIDAGKLLPANPHLTKPVPLSHTITLDESVILVSFFFFSSFYFFFFFFFFFF